MRVAVVGSRKFTNYKQLRDVLNTTLGPDDILVSGGAIGADSMAQRYAKETGGTITIHYPKWENAEGFDRGAGYARNRRIVEDSDLVLAFYSRGRFQQGGTFNTVTLAREADIICAEYQEC